MIRTNRHSWKGQNLQDCDWCINFTIIIREPEAVERLVEVLSSKDVKPVNRKLASAEAMARGEVEY
ncbi:MAG: hypothetical protein ACOY9Y_05295 [Bacillota bacterium]